MSRRAIIVIALLLLAAAPAALAQDETNETALREGAFQAEATLTVACVQESPDEPELGKAGCMDPPSIEVPGEAQQVMLNLTNQAGQTLRVSAMQEGGGDVTAIDRDLPMEIQPNETQMVTFEAPQQNAIILTLAENDTEIGRIVPAAQAAPEGEEEAPTTEEPFADEEPLVTEEDAAADEETFDEEPVPEEAAGEEQDETPFAPVAVLLMLVATLALARRRIG